jgi:hypothetical protein
LKTVLARILALVVAVPLMLASCSDNDATGPGSGSGKSYLRAELSGSFNGKFNATGGLFDPETGTAYGAIMRDSAATIIVVQGVEVDAGDEDGRSIHLCFLNPKVGTYDADKFCYGEDQTDLASCVMVSYFADEAFAILESGSVRITSMDEKRIKGTFQGSGPTWLDNMEEYVPLQIKNGEFDVSILNFEGMFGANELPPGLATWIELHTTSRR